jgi:DNA polymerase
VPIKNGTHRYAEEAEIILSSWAWNDEPAFVLDHTDGAPIPQFFIDAIDDPDVLFVFHGSSFDRTLIRHCWGIDIPTERLHDTLVQALAHGLPGGMEKLCDIYKLDADLAKDKNGSALIQLFTKPLPKNSKIPRATRLTHPAKWEEFKEYARRDIPAMRALKKLMPTWNLTERERALWRLDQKINDRGFAVDLDLARSAITAVNAEQARMRKRTVELTGGEPSSTTQRDALLAHILKEYGVSLPDMAKDTIERRLADETLPEALRELLRIRLSQTTSSTAKYAAALRSASSDSRLRGTIQFCGAMRTGRDSGRLWQPQNLLRPDMSQSEIDLAIEAFKSDTWDLTLDDPMRAAANAMRGMIVASPGKKIVVSDLKNIEGRIAAWLAGEQWKLDAFAAYDAGEGPDLYIAAYARSFGVSVDEVLANVKAKGNWRNIGKVMELALQFAGSVGAFLTFAVIYGVDLEDMALTVFDTLPLAAKTEAERLLTWRKRKGLTTYGLSDRAYVVCQTLVLLWREAHPAIVSYWPELQAAAKNAINHPGVDFPVRRMTYRRDGAWLRLILPSGERSICYPSPRIESGDVTFLGVNQYSRKWDRLTARSSILFENPVQAVARDVFKTGLKRAEEFGFEVLLPVHDEAVTEAPIGDPRLTTDTLSALLSTNPPWLPGCPLAASGFEADKYRKDS